MEDINNREKKKFDAGEDISTYTKEHYDKITVIAPKGTRAVYRTKADEEGKSVTKYILGAVKFYEDHKDKDTESE